MKDLPALLLALPVCLQAGEPAPTLAPTPGPMLPEARESSSGWEISSALYLPLMGLEGRVGLAGIGPFEVDSSFSDILDDMDAGLSAAIEFRNGPWSITADGIWLKLSDSFNPLPNTRFGFQQEQLTFTLSGGYEFYRTESTSLRFLAGAALNFMDLDLNLTPPLPFPAVSRSGSQTWVDPFIGLSLRQQLGGQWAFFADASYGGFGVSSDEYWQALAGFGYHLTENTTLAVAYRVIAMDYQQGGFVYDTETSGPNVGLIVRF